jgi:hypothetical protein
VAPHFIFLMRANMQVRASYAGAQQHEAGGNVLGKINPRAALIHFSRAYQARNASETTSLMTDCGQNDPVCFRSVPDGLARLSDKAAIDPFSIKR